MKIKVKKKIWLKFSSKKSEAQGWTTKEPKEDNGMIKKGDILKPRLMLIIDKYGLDYEFTLKEILDFLKDGTMEIIQ